MGLPIFHTDNKDLQMMQNRWSSEIDPLLARPGLQTVVLPNVALIAGDNTINTLLGRKLQGWRIVRKRAAADIYDRQDTNSSPQLTLILNSSAPVVVDLEVF